MSRDLLMIAGPNGSGKTTYAQPILRQRGIYDEYLNADDIAHGLAPMQPESMALTASKLLIRRFGQLLALGSSFAFETTGAGRNYARHLSLAKDLGYHRELLFLWLPSPQNAVDRVELRVLQGGHSIPRKTIERRYHLGLVNLVNLYLPMMDSALILNSGASGASIPILIKSIDGGIQVRDRVLWEQIQKEAHGERPY
jgi:predicted ABC-type ATPase